MPQAFSQIRIKSIDDDAGIITGIATTPTTDRAGDQVLPEGANLTLPLPLLHGHDRKDVVGTVVAATITPEGIEFVAEVAKDVSESIAEVWRRVKAGLIKYVSIGFKPLEYEPTDTGFLFKKWEWLELSLTTVPCNPQAAITSTKAVNTKVITLEKNKMTLAEQIASFEAKRTETLKAMDTLIMKGATLAGQDETDYKAHEAELAEIDKHLERLKAAEARQAAAATPVVGISGTRIEAVKDNAPAGTDFVRYVKALALSRGNPMQAVEIAKSMNLGNRVDTVLKAAVAAGSTTSSAFTALVEPATMASEFIDLLKPAAIIGRLPALRPAPMDIRIPRAVTGTTAFWVGEGKATPVTQMAFGDMQIGSHKIGAIVPFTEELLRRSDPSADAMVRKNLVDTITYYTDLAFVDQSNAGITGVKPASIFNGGTTAAASGTTADKVRADVKAAKKAAIAANQPLDTAAWIMHPNTALALEAMVNATTSVREFPLISAVSGGFFEGLPVVLSTTVPGTDVAGFDVLLVVQGEIFIAEGGLAIDASREASLEMDSAPTHNVGTPTPAQLVSLWQTGSVAIKAIRGVTWTPRRPTATYRISAAKYA